MFSHTDRLPAAPSPTDVPPAVRPWGLRRMAPYGAILKVGLVATVVDPNTQTGAGPSGEPTQAKHRRSNTGTETKTSTGRGDGKDQGSDEDHSQDSDQD